MESEYFNLADFVARQKKWDLSYLVDAMVEARRSKDPSTKVGGIVVRPDLTTASRGYNGFPRRVADTDERLNDRTVKYELVVHAETNALLTAKEPITGYTMYTTFPPCIRCAVSIIQAGISRVVSIKPTPEQEERWGFGRTREIFTEAGILLDEYDLGDVLKSANDDGILFSEKLLKAMGKEAVLGACDCGGHE